MKKLTTLILSAAIAPAFALGTVAIAGSHDNMQGTTQQPDEELSTGMQNAGDMHTGMQNADKQHPGMPGANGKGNIGTTQQTAGLQPRGEAQMSGKPAGAFYADEVIGANIKHRSSDEDIGEINDLIIDEDGRIVGVVVTTSGFLGLGGQDAGLGWDHIEHSMENGESVFYTNIDEDALRSSPKYERD